MSRPTGPDEEITALEVELARLGATGVDRPVAAAGRATVVIAGGIGRGKTALVNAVLGRNLLRDGVPTAGHVSITGAGPDGVEWLRRHDGPDPQAGPLPDGPVVADRQAVVEIRVAHPLLDAGVELIDTPPLDGLTEDASAITLAAAAHADILVLVLDTTCPLTMPELAFLARAATRTSALLVALTGADRVPDRAELVEENRRLLTRHAARFAGAPIVAVASPLTALAARAEAAGKPDVAARALARSGIPELRAELAGLTGRLDALRLRNRLAACTVAALTLDAADRRVAGETPAANPDAARQRIAELDAVTARFRTDLQREIADLQHELDGALDDDLRRLESRLGDTVRTIRSWTGERAGELAAELEAGLGTVRLDATGRTRDALDRVVARASRTLARAGVTLAAVPQRVGTAPAPAAAQTLVPERDPTTSGFAGAFTTYATASALTFSSHAVLAALVPSLGPIGLGIGLAIGLGGVLARRRALARAQGQRGGQRVVAQAIAETRVELRRRIARDAGDARHVLEAAVAEALRQRTTTLRTELRELTDARRRDAADLQERRRKASARRDALRAVLGRIQAVERQLAG